MGTVLETKYVVSYYRVVPPLIDFKLGRPAATNSPPSDGLATLPPPTWDESFA